MTPRRVLPVLMGVLALFGLALGIAWASGTWNPPTASVALRTPRAVAPRRTRVTITGFRELSLMGPSTGPVSVVLTPAQTSRLRWILTTLPPRPSLQAGCMEDAELFAITVTPARARAASWTASGWACSRAVYVERLAPPRHAGAWETASLTLEDTCSLRGLVASWLPHVDTEWRQSMLASCAPSPLPSPTVFGVRAASPSAR